MALGPCLKIPSRPQFLGITWETMAIRSFRGGCHVSPFCCASPLAQCSSRSRNLVAPSPNRMHFSTIWPNQAAILPPHPALRRRSSNSRFATDPGTGHYRHAPPLAGDGQAGRIAKRRHQHVVGATRLLGIQDPATERKTLARRGFSIAISPSSPMAVWLRYRPQARRISSSGARPNTSKTSRSACPLRFSRSAHSAFPARAVTFLGLTTVPCLAWPDSRQIQRFAICCRGRDSHDGG